MTENNITNNNKINSDARGQKPLVIAVFVSIAVMLVATITGFYYYAYATRRINDEDTVGSSMYEQYYALICDNNEFNRQIYQFAKEKGDELGICVDMLSQRIDYNYTTEELFEIAMESQVDGIIVEAKDGQKMKGLIDKACNEGIDVVTLLSDSPDSLRRSSIQVGAYNLGKAYGQRVVSEKLRGNEQILVIANTANSESVQNLIFTGIKDTVNREAGEDSEIQFELHSVDGSDTFVMEEMIRSLFIDDERTPEIIICPDSQATEIVYQALVDYNKVGNVRVIGYHDSETVTAGIRQGVIEASIVVDVRELGEYSVEALSEYRATGFSSEYYSVDSKLIDASNVSEYVYSDQNLEFKSSKD